MDSKGIPARPEADPAAISEVSLSQVLLAPLDSIFKAQIHAARSFLNMLLQIGYPHQPVDDAGHPLTDDGKPLKNEGKPYYEEFFYETEYDGKKQLNKVRMPALALVPVAPLAVDSASFKLAMRVERQALHCQVQNSEADSLKREGGAFDQSNRPWYLVSDPISIRGTLAPPEGGDAKAQGASTIDIEVKLAKTKIPAGLEKLLTFMTEAACSVKEEEKR